jgi:tetratricopeptide (TPR) repeat protein
MTKRTTAAMAPKSGRQPAGEIPVKGPDRRRSYKRWILTGLLVACLCAVAAMAGYIWYLRSAPIAPAIDLEGVDPPVAAAIADASAALRKSPHSGKAWGKLGMVLFAHGYLAESLSCFAKAERLDPHEARWTYYQGILLTLKDAEGAIVEFRRALELSGGQPDAVRLRLADALLAQGYFDEACEHYRLLLQQHPNTPSSPLAHLGLARAAYESGNWQESLDQLRRCSDSPFTSKQAHSLLAAAERERNLAAHLPADRDARDPWKEEVDQLSVDRLTRLRRGVQFVERNHVREGLMELNDLVRVYPDWDQAWGGLGYAFFRVRDFAKAEQAFNRAIQLAPDSAEAEFYLGAIASERGNIAVAANHFRKATKLRPDYAAAYYFLGRCLSQEKKLAGAEEAFSAAIRYQPYHGAAHRELGNLLAQLGKKTEALRHLSHAVELDPTDEEAKKLLVQVQQPGSGGPR